MTKKNDYWEERTKKRRAALDRNVEKANKELIENFEEALKMCKRRLIIFGSDMQRIMKSHCHRHSNALIERVASLQRHTGRVSAAGKGFDWDL